MALLIGNVASAIAQPRDGVWEGRDDSRDFTIRFVVRGNGTQVVLGPLGSVRFMCPDGVDPRISYVFGGGFTGEIRHDKFTLLDNMKTPRQAEGDWFVGFVFQGTFTDSLHARGRVLGWHATFTGRGLKTQACPLLTQTWRASWVGEESRAAALATEGPADSPATPRALDDELITKAEDAADEIASPTDGVWEGTDSGGFRIQFLVRDNGTAVVVRQFGFVRVVCPTGHRFDAGAAPLDGVARIDEGDFTFLADMPTPSRVQAGKDTGYVVRGTFRDGLHATGTINGWISMLSGRGLGTQACPTETKAWEASWVGPATASATTWRGASSFEAAQAGLVETDLGTLAGVAEVGSARVLYVQSREDHGSGYDSIILRLPPEDTIQPSPAAERPRD